MVTNVPSGKHSPTDEASATTPEATTPTASIALSAVTASDPTKLFAVGGTQDDFGDSISLRSSDGGSSWVVTSTKTPQLSSISTAGARLFGGTSCVARGAGDAAPISCLFMSDDDGVSWTDSRAGRKVEPTFVDQSHGWAHSPGTDDQVQMFATADGGETWTTRSSPCPRQDQLLEALVQTNLDSGYALCVARPTNGRGQDWSLVEILSGGATILRHQGHGRDDASFDDINTQYVRGLAMEASGNGYLWSTLALFKTSDKGVTWASVDLPPDLQTGQFWGTGVVLQSGQAFLINRDTPIDSSVAGTTDGEQWARLTTWPYPL